MLQRTHKRTANQNLIFQQKKKKQKNKKESKLNHKNNYKNLLFE